MGGPDRWTTVPTVPTSAEEASRTTLVVTTYNRPAYVERLLGHLRARGLRAPLLLVDASEDEVRAENERRLHDLFPSASFLGLPSTTSLADTYKRALHSIATEFVAYCPDDDFLDPAFVSAGESFLRAHPDYVLCSGRFALASRNDSTAFFSLQSNGSVEQDDPFERFCHLVANYWPTLRSVQRTHVAIDAATALDAYDHHTILGEALHRSIYALYGKIKVLDQIGPVQFEHGTRNQRRDPAPQTLLCDDSFRRCLHVFRACVAARLSIRGAATATDLDRHLRRAILRHLANNYWLWRDGALAQLQGQFPTITEDHANQVYGWLTAEIERHLLPELRRTEPLDDSNRYEAVFKVLHFACVLQIGDNGRRWHQDPREMDGMAPAAWSAFRRKWALARASADQRNEPAIDAIGATLLRSDFVDRYQGFRRARIAESRRRLRRDLPDERVEALLDCLTVIAILERIGRLGGHDFELVRDIVTRLGDPASGVLPAFEEIARWMAAHPTPEPDSGSAAITPAADSPAARWCSDTLRKDVA